MDGLRKLHEMRGHAGKAVTKGLSDETVQSFLQHDKKLARAIDEAHEAFSSLRREYPELIKLDEAAMIGELQVSYVNFYQADAINPYVALAAKGPWLITAHGAVIHDSGGYGMLGFGHGPDAVLKVLGRNQVMANVMTASFSQRRLTDKLFCEIGHARPEGKRKPYAKFLCLNSGSEAMTAAARIADLNAKLMTDPGGKHAGKKIKMLALRGGFHGRTERPSQASDSSRDAYRKLATFRDQHQLVTVAPNDVSELKNAFARAREEGVFFEFMFMEPVMGEGNPGKAATVEFYNAARELTKADGTLLLVDSIQAGLRAHGSLSMMDYPGFEDCTPPDMETYSKALNAGQFPLSVLALTQEAAAIYQRGIYGNTMTSNPRALDVACAVLDSVTPALRRNISERGQEILQKFGALQKEFPGVVTEAQGTGLLCALSLNEDGYRVVGSQCVEQYMRQQGIGVIHGGKNALRFTPHFEITSAEVDLVIDGIRQALNRGPVYR